MTLPDDFKEFLVEKCLLQEFIYNFYYCRKNTSDGKPWGSNKEKYETVISKRMRDDYIFAAFSWMQTSRGYKYWFSLNNLWLKKGM